MSLEKVNIESLDSGSWTEISSGLWVNGNIFCCDSDLSPILPSLIPQARWNSCHGQNPLFVLPAKADCGAEGSPVNSCLQQAVVAP